MAWRTEKNGSDIDIIIDGWQAGIADDPYSGIADLRGINITSNPNEAAVGFANTAVTLPPIYNAVAYTCAAATDIITVSTTSGFYNGMAIIINSISGAIGLSATAGSNTYYVNNITATTFKLYKELATSGTAVDILLNGSGTLSTAQFGTPVDSVAGIASNALTVSGSDGQIYNNTFILDNNGQVWMIGNGSTGYAQNTLQFFGNTNHSTILIPQSVGICIFKNYLFVFLGAAIDYIDLVHASDGTGPNGQWTIGWKTTSYSVQGHKAIAATDDAMYFCNNQTVGSLLQNAGATFNPATPATYTYNTSALALPTNDYARCLAQLGTSLLVGGCFNSVYPWDRISTSFNYPLIVAESYIKRIVSTNSSAYIFAGNSGRIYLTNGANIQLYKKFPDQISSTEKPYYTWGDALYYRNQLYFSVSVTNNAGTAISNFAGVWAIDIDSDALYMLSPLSNASYAGSVPVLLPMGKPNTSGNALIVSYINGSNAGGIDVGSTSPYTNYEAYIDTDIIPIGTYYDITTDQQIEYKLSKPLVSGESIRIAWRGNLNDAFTTVWTSSTTGQLSDAKQVNFQKQQWIQLRISMSSTASSPSYDKLREIRIR